MYRDFGTVLIFALLGIVLVYVPLLIQKLVAPSQKTPDKLANYECGEEPEGSAWVQSVSYTHLTLPTIYSV